MSDLERLGPVYDLGDGTRLQDLDGGCNRCGKRLAEVIADPCHEWSAGQIVCIDCGLVHADARLAHRVTIKAALRGGGHVAVCTCRWSWFPTTLEKATRRADEHRHNSIRGTA